jgi:Organic solute transporter Ostalpha
VISFLSSAGAIKVSDKLANQDIQIGLPNLLLCIEMAIFAVLHFFAFPWKPYLLKNQQASDDPQYINGQVAYQGGPLGVKAFIESFNPWDLVKATGRGFRWLFVGYRKRTTDPSYMNQDDGAFSLKPSDDDAQPLGSNVAAYPGPAGLNTAYHPANQYDTSGEEDQNLLSHAQDNPQSHAYDDESGAAGVYSNRYYGQVYSHDDPSVGYLAPAEPRPISPRPHQPYHPSHSPYEGA